MRLAWASDIHLDFVPQSDHAALFARLVADRPDALLISGDIANGPTVCRVLADMQRAIEQPIYFVLGNHDFYGRGVRSFRGVVAEFTAAQPRLRYLTALGVVPLADDLALIGHDGWADARLGDYDRSRVFLNDFVRIDEFAYQLGPGRRRVMQELADEAAAHLRTHLAAAARFKRLIVLTHVPPFAEAGWFEGRPSDPDWLPFFTSKSAGDALRGAADQHSACEITVLCGHTHGAADVQITPNLRVIAAQAEYRSPSLQRIITF